MIAGFLLGFLCAEVQGGYSSRPSLRQRAEELFYQDKVIQFMKSTKEPLYTQYITNLELKKKIHIGKTDPLDYLQYGKIFATALQEEISAQCYYMAHLKDPDNIQANSELKFDTYITRSMTKDEEE